MSSVSTPEILPKFVPLSRAEAFALVSWQMSRHDVTSLFVARFLGKCRDMSSTSRHPKFRQMSKRLSRHLGLGQLFTAGQHSQPIAVAAAACGALRLTRCPWRGCRDIPFDICLDLGPGRVEDMSRHLPRNLVA